MLKQPVTQYGDYIKTYDSFVKIYAYILLGIDKVLPKVTALYCDHTLMQTACIMNL